jgi:hypothetical protein
MANEQYARKQALRACRCAMRRIRERFWDARLQFNRTAQGEFWALMAWYEAGYQSLALHCAALTKGTRNQ